MRKAERREPPARWLCHGHVMAMPRLGSLFYQAVQQLPVVRSAQRALSHPRKSPFNDPLPHFPFGPFPRALCRPGSSS